MIQVGSFLSVIDNSGAKEVLCIKILNAGYMQRYAIIGSLVLVSIKTTRFSRKLKIKKGEIHKALIVRSKNLLFSKSYNYKSFYNNSVILLNKQNKPIGTRIFGVLPKSFKYNRFLKITSLSSGLII